MALPTDPLTTFDPADDWLDYLCLDGQEQVTFSSVGPAGASAVSVANAVGLAVPHAEVRDSDGLFAEGDRVWHLPVGLLGGLAPKAGDTVLDAAGVLWVAYGAGGVRLICQGTAWRLVCHRSKASRPL